MSIIGHKAKFIELEPSLPSEVPPLSLFVDSTNNNTPTYKNQFNVPGEIGTTVGTANLFMKTMISGGLFLANRPLSKLPDGHVVLLDANDLNTNRMCAYSMEESTVSGMSVQVLCIGPNMAGAVSGMGFNPGDTLFIGEHGEFVNSTSGFSGINDTIIQVGIADCADATASPIATDLIAIADLVAY